MGRLKRNMPQYILCALLLLLCIIMMLPFCWMFSTSLRLPKDSFSLPPHFFPTDFHIENYATVFTEFPFWTFIKNSIVVAVMSVLFNFMGTTMAAFAFSRIQFKGRNLIFMIFLSGLMIPGQATMIPVFLFMRGIGLVGNYWALILPSVISPMAIFLVRQFMMTIPPSYDEAAYIDGASRIIIFAKIILPMCKPVLILTTLQAFLGSWNNFMGPLIYLSEWEDMTLPMGMKILSGYKSTGSIAVVLAGVIISITIPTIIYLFGNKYLLQGVSLDGLKS